MLYTMVMYEKQPILDKFKTVLNFSRHISYSIKTLFRGLLSSSVRTSNMTVTRTTIEMMITTAKTPPTTPPIIPALLLPKEDML